MTSADDCNPYDDNKFYIHVGDDIVEFNKKAIIRFSPMIKEMIENDREINFIVCSNKICNNKYALEKLATWMEYNADRNPQYIRTPISPMLTDHTYLYPCPNEQEFMRDLLHDVKEKLQEDLERLSFYLILKQDNKNKIGNFMEQVFAVKAISYLNANRSKIIELFNDERD